MFQQYQYAIMSTNFNCFAYLLMCSTHSSSMSPLSTIFIRFQILFVFNLLSMSFLLFQQLLASSCVQEISMFSVAFLFQWFFIIFSCICKYTYRKMKVFKCNQMVNAKVLIMPNCKQLNI